MNALQTLLLLVTGACASDPPTDIKALHQFRRMILCKIPDSWPILEFSNYGCYCGMGGSGEPVDDLDRCCQVHDNCYGDAMQHEECWPIIDHPYISLYSYSCDKTNGSLICGENNNGCKKFICECDRKAAECFARSRWNHEHHRMSRRRCRGLTSVGTQGGQTDLILPPHTEQFLISLLRGLLFLWSLLLFLS